MFEKCSILKCLLGVSVLLFQHSLFAQDAHPLQSELTGAWMQDSAAGVAEQQQFLNGAEKNLSAAGEDYRASYGPGDTATATCSMAGALAGRAADIEILDRGDVLDLVAFGRTRRIYMDYELEPPESFVPNPLGWSVGRWAGDMLVIRTTRFSEGNISSGGRPLPFGGPIAQMVERYTLSDDHNGLTVDINLNDPKYYRFSLNVRHRYLRTETVSRSEACTPGA